LAFDSVFANPPIIHIIVHLVLSLISHRLSLAKMFVMIQPPYSSELMGIFLPVMESDNVLNALKHEPAAIQFIGEFYIYIGVELRQTCFSSIYFLFLFLSLFLFVRLFVFTFATAVAHLELLCVILIFPELCSQRSQNLSFPHARIMEMLRKLNK
jgi:hypothetical protein